MQWNHYSSFHISNWLYIVPKYKRHILSCFYLACVCFKNGLSIQRFSKRSDCLLKSFVYLIIHLWAFTNKCFVKILLQHSYFSCYSESNLNFFHSLDSLIEMHIERYHFACFLKIHVSSKDIQLIEHVLNLFSSAKEIQLK